MKTGRKLASREEAVEYNKRQSACLLQAQGCIDSMACENCCHVITDEICCCGGIGKCPNCGYEAPPKYLQGIPITMPTGDPRDFANYFVVNPEYRDNVFQYVGDWPKDLDMTAFKTFQFPMEIPKIELPKEKTPRAEVYQAIDGERDYQDKQWSGKDHEHEVGAYITLLASYVQKAQTAWTDKSGDYDALHVIRKIAGIAVHCMEEHGAPKRGEVINQDGEKILTAN